MKYTIMCEKGSMNSVNRSAYLLRVAKKAPHSMGIAVVCEGIGDNDNDAKYASHYVVNSLEKVFDQLKKQKLDLKDKVSSVYKNLFEIGDIKKTKLEADMSLFYFLDDDCSLVHVGQRKLHIFNQNGTYIDFENEYSNTDQRIWFESFKWNENDAVALFSECMEQDINNDQLRNRMTEFIKSSKVNEVEVSAFDKMCSRDMTAIFYSRK